MIEFKTGGLVKSLAGHDKGEYYIIIGVGSEYVDLSDGKRRPVEKPKRKNKKHLQVIHQEADRNRMTNEEIRRFIRIHKQ